MCCFRLQDFHSSSEVACHVTQVKQVLRNLQLYNDPEVQSCVNELAALSD